MSGRHLQGMICESDSSHVSVLNQHFWVPSGQSISPVNSGRFNSPIGFRMGEEMEKQYLSDATGRLVNPDLWGPRIQAEIGKLAEGAGPEIQMRLADLNCTVP